MYSSPVRRFTNVLLRLLARLACIRRAASVHSEPGSNSHKGVLRIWTKGHHFNTLTPLLNILYSVVKEQKHSSREPCTILCAPKRVKGPFYQIMVGYSLKPHALTATLARGYRGKKHKHPANRWEDNKGPPHESSTICMHDEIIISPRESPVSMGL